MEDAIVELIKSLESLAPHVWRIMVKQAYVEAGQKLLWSIVFFTEQESAFVEEPMTRRRFEIPLDDLEHAVNV